jgi:hypothetical protein
MVTTWIIVLGIIAAVLFVKDEENEKTDGEDKQECR